MKVVVIPGLTLREVTPEDVERIRVAGGDATVVVTDNEGAHEEIADADVVFGFVSRKMYLGAQNLRWVHAISSGVDAFLYDEFKAGDVVLTSEKGLVGDHLADHAIGLLLMLTRQLATALRYGADSWNHRPEMRIQEVELTGSTMGIYGFGGTGKAIAKRAAGFGMRITALDRDPVEPTAEVPHVRGVDEFDAMLAESDVVAIGAPLTPETKGKFDAHAFRQMKDSAFLVNVTRGEILVEDDLVAALENGEILGAGLDVVPREPLPPESALWSLPNVVMTPHTAGASQFRAGRNVDRFISNLERLVRDEPLEGVIDKELGY